MHVILSTRGIGCQTCVSGIKKVIIGEFYVDTIVAEANSKLHLSEWI